MLVVLFVFIQHKIKSRSDKTAAATVSICAILTVHYAIKSLVIYSLIGENYLKIDTTVRIYTAFNFL